MDLPDVDNTEEFRCISLCTGYAGLELGIKRAVPSLRTVCYVEIEAFACANLVAKIEAGELDAAPVWTDIKTFNGRPFRKRVHIVTAGYPCQPFSTAGKRKGTSDPRHLWPYIKRAIRCIEPPYCFFENVSGHLNIGFQTVYKDLVKLGYSVEAGLFTAAEVGAPHRRKRLFVLAYRSNSRCEAMQIQQAGEPALRSGCGSVGDTRGTESGRLSGSQRQEGSTIRQTSELADTNSKRPQGSGSATKRRGSKPCTYYADVWPARSGRPQYEWEEPRVVDNAQQRRHEPKNGQIQTGRDGVKYTDKDVANSEQRCRGGQDGDSQRLQRTIETARSDKGQVKSRLGRAANGTSSRVDRLRLLGNGVVPQQAELAFRVLISTFAEANR